MDNQPKLMNYSRMKGVFDAHMEQMFKHAFINSELGVLYGDPSVFKLIIQQHKPPFTINDFRMGVISKGQALVRVNLVEKKLESGSLLFVGPGSIIHPLSFTSDLEIYGIGLFADFPMPFAVGQMPSAFNGQVRDFQIKASESDIATTRNIIDTIWHVVHQPDYNRQTVSSLVAAMMYHYDGIYRQHIDLMKASQSREQTIFDRFIFLVNQHATHEHQISFYAGRMCLTERYLGTVIRQASGTTAKEWIDRALVEHIKIELKHTDKPLVQISEEMDFPNPSFFSKYFKRLTGQTPLEYRQSNRY